LGQYFHDSVIEFAVPYSEGTSGPFTVISGPEIINMSELQELMQKILSFRDERNWKQFHTPRNLAAALAIEAGELQEQMLWKTDDEVVKLLNSPEGKKNISAEIADVLIYGLLFCDATAIDPVSAITEKLIENDQKYPAELARNNAAKYTMLK
jgi:NTP pyrophosphatase (non-canonical NTP hydrolase)